MQQLHKKVQEVEEVYRLDLKRMVSPGLLTGCPGHTRGPLVTLAIRPC